VRHGERSSTPSPLVGRATPRMDPRPAPSLSQTGENGPDGRERVGRRDIAPYIRAPPTPARYGGRHR
jgi:hypothetical protein